MSCVLEILSYDQLLARKLNLLKQLEKVDNELLKRNLNDHFKTDENIIEDNIDENIIENKTQDIDNDNFNEDNKSEEIITENQIIHPSKKKIRIKVNIVRKK